MSKKISTQTKEFLLTVPLPEKTKSYTPIAHKYAIDKISSELLKNNFTISGELYRSSMNGNIANGIYCLDFGDDEELKMVCCFSNSYDKSTRFSIAIGAQVVANGNYLLSDSSWIRKHSGTADKEADLSIVQRIANAKSYYDSLVKMKNAMKDINCTKDNFADLIGRMYLYQYISTEQISICFRSYREFEIDNPEKKLDLWTAYNFILKALYQSHPSKWLFNQIMANAMVCNMFKIYEGKEKELAIEFPEDDNKVEEAEEEFKQDTPSDIVEVEDNTQEQEVQVVEEEPAVVEEPIQTIEESAEEQVIAEPTEIVEQVTNEEVSQVIEEVVEKDEEVIEESADNVDNNYNESDELFKEETQIEDNSIEPVQNIFEETQEITTVEIQDNEESVLEQAPIEVIDSTTPQDNEEVDNNNQSNDVEKVKAFLQDMGINNQFELQDNGDDYIVNFDNGEKLSLAKSMI